MEHVVIQAAGIAPVGTAATFHAAGFAPVGTLADPASAEVRVLGKSLVLDLSSIDGVPEKIEGVAVLDQRTIAISNDNDFDSEEGQYDDAGNNVGKGKKSKILIISLDKPLPLPTAAASAR